jgi:hypothetical protein
MLVFCTSFINDEVEWQKRYKRWLIHHKKVFPAADFVFIDDGSPFVPEEQDIPVFENLSQFRPGEEAVIFRFPDRLGRRSVRDFPGWFRSFFCSVDLARKLQHEKIVHIESDAFVLTKRTRDYVETRSAGWTAFYCPRWNFPESAFQIVCKDAFQLLDHCREAPYELNFNTTYIEKALPFTNIETTIHGDRYGEFRKKVPRSADFAAQVSPEITFSSEFDD